MNRDPVISDVAERFGMQPSEVKKIVESFFSVFAKEAKRMNLDDSTKIYSKDRFEALGKVRCIPSIGRLGPSYSRYLKWRANESRDIEQHPKSMYGSRLTRDDIEEYADRIISGETPSIRKKRGNEMYNRVWIVGAEGKKQARQVIPKTIQDVQDKES